MEEELRDYTIRDMETGAVQSTGYVATCAEDAVKDFYRDRPNYDGEVYASPEQWND